MQNFKRYTILVTSILYLISCNNSIKYPDGGYNYPKHVADKDTNFYYYPLKNIESKKYVFGDSYQYILYQLFEEPNLSIKPLPKETFRLTYDDAFGERILIILTDSLLTVKKGNTRDLSYIDTSRLTTIENLHLKLLNRWYPIDTVNKSPQLKRYLDSMIKLYPLLLDPNYYHSIYEKQFVRTDKKFTYECSKIQLSNEQYDLIAQQINSSGFWALPYLIECNEIIADGGDFTLESNTKYKYQKVTMRICPNNKTKLTTACQNLIRIAKLDQEIDLIWNEDKTDTADTIR